MTHLIEQGNKEKKKELIQIIYRKVTLHVFLLDPAPRTRGQRKMREKITINTAMFY